MAKLSRQELLERAQLLAEIGGIDLPLEQIMEGLAVAEDMLDKGIPPVRQRARTKSKAYRSDLEDILGKELARLAAAGEVTVEDAKTRTPRTVDALAAQALARERAAAWERWRRDQGRRNAYRGFWGDGSERKKSLRRMPPADRKTAFLGFMGGPQEKK